MVEFNLTGCPKCWPEVVQHILALLVKHKMSLCNPVPELQHTPEIDLLGTRWYHVQAEQIRQFHARHEAWAQNLIQQPKIHDPVNKTCEDDHDTEMHHVQADIWAQHLSLVNVRGIPMSSRLQPKKYSWVYL